MRRHLAMVLAACAAVISSSALGNSLPATPVDVSLTPRIQVRGTLSGRGEVDVFRYSAPPATVLTFALTGNRTIGFDVHLFGPGAAEIPLAGLPRFVSRAGSMSLTKYALPADGAYELRVGSAAPGTYLLRWTATPGATRLAKCDLRCATLGRTLGDETAVGRLVDAGDTTTLDVASSSDIAGTRLVVPAGAVPDETLLLVTSSAAFAPPDPSSYQAAGPAVGVQPSDAAFSSPAAVTLPYDPLLVPRSADARKDLHVAALGLGGDTTVLAPTAVDTVRHTVTVAANAAARFVVFSPKGPPDPTGTEYWYGGVSLMFGTDGSGADSRERFIHVETSRMTFGAGGSLTSSGDGFETSWSHDDQGVGHVEQAADRGRSETLGWEFDPDGRSLHMIVPHVGTFVLEPSEDGSILVEQARCNETVPMCSVSMGLRRSARAPTREAIAGTYWIGTVTLHAVQQGASPVELEVSRTFGTATLRADGTWSLSDDETRTNFDPGHRSVKTLRRRSAVKGTWTILGPSAGWSEGAVELTIAGGQAFGPIRLFPSADRSAFYGTIDPTTGGDHMFVVGVRRAAGLTASSLDGTFAVGGFDLGMETYAPPATPPGPGVGDVPAMQSDVRVTFDRTPRLHVVSQLEKEVRRDDAAPGGVRIDIGTDVPPSAVPFSLAPTGRLTVRGDPTQRAVGAVAPGARAAFAVVDPARGSGRLGIRLFVKSPPTP
jgi:hypothetical protein